MVKKALFVRLKAKAGKEAEVEKFLNGGLGLVQQEPLTTVWYALKFDDKDVPLGEWERLNKELLPTTEFKDEGVEAGEIYFYYVRAVDSKGIESAPSEVVRVLRK
jgi:hypothetical protein